MELGRLCQGVVDIIEKYRGNSVADERLAAEIRGWSDVVVHNRLLRKVAFCKSFEEYNSLVFNGSFSVRKTMSDLVYDLHERGILKTSNLTFVVGIGDLRKGRACRIRNCKVISSPEFYNGASGYAEEVVPVGFNSQRAKDSLAAKLAGYEHFF